MKFVIAPDSFKGSLTAKEAADDIAIGIRKVFAENPEVFDPRKYMGPGRDLIKEAVVHKIRDVFGSANKA